MTGRPSAWRALAFASTLSVADSAMAAIRAERRGCSVTCPAYFAARARAEPNRPAHLRAGVGQTSHSWYAARRDDADPTTGARRDLARSAPRPRRGCGVRAR